MSVSTTRWAGTVASANRFTTGTPSSRSTTPESANVSTVLLLLKTALSALFVVLGIELITDQMEVLFFCHLVRYFTPPRDFSVSNSTMVVDSRNGCVFTAIFHILKKKKKIETEVASIGVFVLGSM